MSRKTKRRISSLFIVMVCLTLSFDSISAASMRLATKLSINQDAKDIEFESRQSGDFSIKSLPFTLPDYTISKITGYAHVRDASLNHTITLVLFDQGYAIYDGITDEIIVYDLEFVPEIMRAENFNDFIVLSPSVYGLLKGRSDYYSVYLNDGTALSLSELAPYSYYQKEIRAKIMSRRVDHYGEILNQQDIMVIQSSTIPQARMERYSGTGISSSLWINSTSNNQSFPNAPSGGLCGTYASGALLAYYDDYVNNTIVPESIRQRYSSSPEKLLSTIYFGIDYGRNGTLPNHLSSGINLFFNNYSVSNVNASYWLLGTWNRVVASIDRARPIIVGMTSLAGSPPQYGNHFVLVYQYFYDSNGVKFYRCVDNHGSFTANINVSWTIGTVSLNT